MRSLPSAKLLYTTARHHAESWSQLFAGCFEQGIQLLREHPARDLGDRVAFRTQSLLQIGDRGTVARFGELKRAFKSREGVIHMARIPWTAAKSDSGRDHREPGH